MNCNCNDDRTGHYCPVCGQPRQPCARLLGRLEDVAQVVWFAILRAVGRRSWRWGRPAIWLPALKPGETAHVEGEGWRVERKGR
jgi:hypothetical protein